MAHLPHQKSLGSPLSINAFITLTVDIIVRDIYSLIFVLILIKNNDFYFTDEHTDFGFFK